MAIVIKDNLRYMIQAVELFCVCCQSQHIFINQLFSKQITLTGLVLEIQDFFNSNGHKSLVHKYQGI